MVGQKKLQLKYPPNVTEEDLISRVMGPDAWGAHYYVVTVFQIGENTVANLWPLPPDAELIQNPFDMSGYSTRVAF